MVCTACLLCDYCSSYLFLVCTACLLCGDFDLLQSTSTCTPVTLRVDEKGTLLFWKDMNKVHSLVTSHMALSCAATRSETTLIIIIIIIMILSRYVPRKTTSSWCCTLSLIQRNNKIKHSGQVLDQVCTLNTPAFSDAYILKNTWN